jgi:hypothetical protein
VVVGKAQIPLEGMGLLAQQVQVAVVAVRTLETPVVAAQVLSQLNGDSNNGSLCRIGLKQYCFKSHLFRKLRNGK